MVDPSESNSAESVATSSYLDSISAYGKAGVPEAPVFADPEHDAAFRRDGYIILPLLNEEEVAELLKLHSTFNPNQQSEFDTTIFNPDPSYRTGVRVEIDRIVQPRALPLLANYKRAVSNFINKRHETKNARVWIHQDYTFVDQSRYSGVHVWIPLVDVDETNGCMSIYPGTHSLINHISAQPYQSYQCFPNPYENVSQMLEKGGAVAAPMKAGYGLFFNERTLHSSGENYTGIDRVVVNCAYIPEDEPMYLYAPSPEEDGVLDMVELLDISFLHLMHQKPLPVPYPDAFKLVGTVNYKPTMLTQDDIKHMLRPGYVHVHEVEDPNAPNWHSDHTISVETVSAAPTPIEVASPVAEPAAVAVAEPVAVATAAPASKPSWIRKLFGRGN